MRAFTGRLLAVVAVGLALLAAPLPPLPTASGAGTAPAPGPAPAGAPTPAPGPARARTDGPALTPWQVQGYASTSPYLGQTISVAGVVTADYQRSPARKRGFYLQDPAGSPDPRASAGLFVSTERGAVEVAPGMAVVARGAVVEVFGQTQLTLDPGGLTVGATGQPVPLPVELDPPGDPAAAAAYLEAREGMLVSVPGCAPVVAPSDRFGTFYVVHPRHGLARLMAGVPATAGLAIAVAAEGGVRADVRVGECAAGVTGPLDYAFGAYRVLPGAPLGVQSGLSPAVPVGGGLASDEFDLATLNLANLFDTVDDPLLDDMDLSRAEYARKLDKLAAAIAEGLRGPTLLAVQEAEHVGVLEDLAAHPRLAPLRYRPVLIDGPDPRGIDVGLLYRDDRVRVTGVEAHQVCTPLRDGAFPTLPDGRPDPRFFCPAGDPTGTFLFPRPPLVVDLEVFAGPEGGRAAGPLPLTVVAVHLKSKVGSDPEEQAFATRRRLQAEELARLVDGLAARGAGNVAVAGDFNDLPDSEPLRIVTAGGRLVDLAQRVPAASRYTYIFSGLSDVRDYVLASPALAALANRVEIGHFGADFPEALADSAPAGLLRASDHDAPLARFRFDAAAGAPVPRRYWLSLYNGTETASPDWLHIANPNPAAVTATVSVGGAVRWSGRLGPGEDLPLQFPGLRGGPVAVATPDDRPLVVSRRTLWGESFHELPAVAEDDLAAYHVLPRYDSISTGGRAWLIVANPGAAPLDFAVRVGGTPRSTGRVEPNGLGIVVLPETAAGPVEVSSHEPGNPTRGRPALVTLRSLWFDGAVFSELPATPGSWLAPELRFSYYDAFSTEGRDRLQIANVNPYTVTAVVRIGSTAAFTRTLAPRTTAVESFPGLRDGPIIVRGSQAGRPGAPANLAVVHQVFIGRSVGEIAGQPPLRLRSRSVLPWYDSVPPGTSWLFALNPARQPITATVRLAGAVVGTLGVPGGGYRFLQLPGRSAGPVEIVAVLASDGTTPMPVQASQRVLWGGRFSEAPGTPPR